MFSFSKFSFLGNSDLQLFSLIGTLDKRAGEISEVAHSIEQYDWHMIEVYENVLRFIVESASR